MFEALLGTSRQNENKEPDPIFQVKVERTVTHHVWIEVTAKDESAAFDLALQRAGDIDFHNGIASEPEYSIGEISALVPDASKPASPKC